MSSQSLNGNPTTGYVGYIANPSATNPNGSIPTRDASDITRQLKERLIYNGFNSSKNVTPGGANLNFQRPQLNPAGVNHIPGNSEWSWLPYGNQFRLSYLFGKLKNSSTGSVIGNSSTISATSTSNGVATVTVGSTAGFVPGASVVISGATTTPAYNGSYVIASVISSTQFTILTSVTGTGNNGTATVGVSGGVFNGNGPALPGKSTSVGS